MELPTFVYRCPGNHQCPGGTFDYKQVSSDDELTKAIKDGWYPTLPFAQDPANFDLEAFLKVAQPEAQPKRRRASHGVE